MAITTRGPATAAYDFPRLSCRALPVLLFPSRRDHGARRLAVRSRRLRRPRHFLLVPFLVEVPRRRDQRNSRTASQQEKRLQEGCAVTKKKMPPAALHHLRDHHGNR